MKSQVYIISLKRDEKRRDELKKRFKNYNEFIIIDAVDAREFECVQYYEFAVKSYLKFGKLLSPGEIGCALSHIKTYEEFLKSGADFALILEDDIIGDDIGIQKAFKMAEKIDKNGVLICGGQDGLSGRFSAFGKMIFEDLFLVSKYSKSVITRACAYVVGKASAKALLKAHENGVCIADLWQVLLKDQNMYFCDIFSHPLDLKGSNLESQRVAKGEFKPTFKTHFRSLKYIILTRIEMIFCSYKRIFKR